MISMKGCANSHLVVSPQDLAPVLAGAAAPRPLLLDLRPPDEYAAGHIPGAIHVDLWGVSLIDTDPAPLKAFMWMIETSGVRVRCPGPGRSFYDQSES